MKKTFLIIFALFLLLPAYAQDCYYHDGKRIVHLTVDSTAVVMLTPKKQALVAALPSHFKLKESLPYGNMRLDVYGLTIKKNRYNLSDSKLFPKELPMMPCYRTESGEDWIPTGAVFVMLKNKQDTCILREAAQKVGAKIIRNIMSYWYELEIIPGRGYNSINIANQLYDTGLFEYAEPEFYNPMILEISYDAAVHKQWALYNKDKYETGKTGYDISVSEAWNYATGSGIKIAVIEDSIDTTHDDLKDNIYRLKYSTNMDIVPDTTDINHGTHCAGIAAAVRNNGKSIAGVAPDAKIMAISIKTKKVGDLSAGIEWAWKHGADVISCSWRIRQRNNLVENAIDSAVTRGRNGKGCVVVNSAGNDGTITFPGNCKGVIAVTNIKRDGTLGIGYACGDSLFIAAPGTDIASTLPGNRVGLSSGTSMAAPHVAGVAALILQRNPDLTAEEVRKILATTADKIGTEEYETTRKYGLWNDHYGYGLVNACKAVKGTPLKEQPDIFMPF